jgi:hypothetical protein
LSIATSFTFEAAIFGSPIFQYYIPRNKRRTEHESAIFDRVDISDHILNYFLPYLRVANDSMELAGLINSFQTNTSLRPSPIELLNMMGFPPAQKSWDGMARQLIEEMSLA